MAGQGYGIVAIPRISQEVIVEFLESDPVRPIVTGRVFNGEQPVPYPLPESAHITGLRSRSTPGGGGYSELAIHDAKGKELVSIHAQKNMVTTVRENHMTLVHGADQSNHVTQGSQTTLVHKNIDVASETGQIRLSAQTEIIFQVGVSKIRMRAEGVIEIQGRIINTVIADPALLATGSEIPSHEEVMAGDMYAALGEDPRAGWPSEIGKEKLETAGRWEEVAYGDPSGTVGGGGGESVWLPSTPMTYAEQMQKVAKVARGARSGLVNGTPKLIADAFKLTGKANIMSQLARSGVGFDQAEMIADKTLSSFPSGEILKYQETEERLGGHFGEVLSPFAYGKAVNLGSRALSLYRSMPDEFGQLATTGGASASTNFPNHLSFANRVPDEIYSIEPVTFLNNKQALQVSGKILYVVKEDGKLIMARSNNNSLFGHFDLARGENVLAAGEARIVNGHVKIMDNASGHYLPLGPTAEDAARRAFQHGGFKVPDSAFVHKVYDFKLGKWVPHE